MDTFAAISDPTRRTILEMLAAQGQMSASDIYEKFPASPQAISQHLKVLRDANLVLVKKLAQKRLYNINPEPLTDMDVWLKRMTTMWNKRFAVLDTLIASEKAVVEKGKTYAKK